MVKKHETFVRQEFRDGMRFPEYRVWCSKGDFEDKTWSWEEAKQLGGRHELDKNGRTDGDG